MATVITAGNATNGLSLSADNVGAFEFKTGTGAGTTAISVDSSQNVTFAGAASGGNLYLVPNARYFRLNSGLVGSNVNTAQSVFGVGITLTASTVYAFEAVYVFNKTAGATSHTFGLGFGGTATVNNIIWQFTGYDSTSTNTSVNSSQDSGYVTSVSNTTVSRANASATLNNWKMVRGTVSISAGGTFIPQYTLSAAPGGAYTTAAGSYFMIYPIGAAGANVNIGSWA